jgi:hypothetical protein
VIGYVVGRPWVLMLPWAVVAALVAVGALEAVRASDWEDLPFGVALLGTYALVLDIPLGIGIAVTVIRGRHRGDHRPYPR